jgi:hypothetical protein
MNVPTVNMVAIWIAVVIGLTSPVALGFSWHIYETKFRKEAPQQRTRVTFVAMILASTGLLLLPIFVVVHVMQIGSPASTARVIPVQLGFALAGVGVEILALGLCFFGRAKAMFPIACACLGVSVLWVFSFIH